MAFCEVGSFRQNCAKLFNLFVRLYIFSIFWYLWAYFPLLFILIAVMNDKKRLRYAYLVEFGLNKRKLKATPLNAASLPVDGKWLVLTLLTVICVHWGWRRSRADSKSTLYTWEFIHKNTLMIFREISAKSDIFLKSGREICHYSSRNRLGRTH